MSDCEELKKENERLWAALYELESLWQNHNEDDMGIVFGRFIEWGGKE